MNTQSQARVVDGGSLESDLVEMLQNHDRASLETLYDHYSSLAYSLALRMIGEGEAAEDVVQEAFVQAWNNGHMYDAQDCTVQTWLLQIIHHLCTQKLAARRRKPQSASAMRARSSASATGRPAENGVARRDARVALHGLPLEQRETLELAYFGGYSPAQIAVKTGAPLMVVNDRLREGLQRLHQLLRV